MAVGRKTGGRVKGALNRKTIERHNAESLEVMRLAGIDTVANAGKPKAVAEAVTTGKRPAKEILRTFMELFAGRAAFHQPWPLTKGKNPYENIPEFYRNAELAVAAAKDLAPFESPKYSAVVIGATVTNKIEVVGGLPESYADDEGMTIDARPDDGGGVLRLAGPTADHSSGAAPDVPPGPGEASPGDDQAQAGSGPLRKALG
jgi:hypothetical protein